MKTWHIRVVDRQGRLISQKRALLRYMLSWIWFVPPLAVIAPYHLSGGASAVIVLGWVAIWALLSRLHPAPVLARCAGGHAPGAPRTAAGATQEKYRRTRTAMPDTPPPAAHRPEPPVACHGLFAGRVARGWNKKAFRQEVLLAAVLLPLACWLGRGWVETRMLTASVVLVLITELLNSGIEAAIDRIGPELHDLSKRARTWAVPPCCSACCCAALSGLGGAFPKVFPDG